MLGRIIEYTQKDLAEMSKGLDKVMSCSYLFSELKQYMRCHSRHIVDIQTRPYLAIPFFSTKVSEQVYVREGIGCRICAKSRFGRMKKLTIYLLSDEKDVEPLEQLIREKVPEICQKYNRVH